MHTDQQRNTTQYAQKKKIKQKPKEARLTDTDERQRDKQKD